MSTITLVPVMHDTEYRANNVVFRSLAGGTQTEQLFLEFAEREFGHNALLIPEGLWQKRIPLIFPRDLVYKENLTAVHPKLSESESRPVICACDPIASFPSNAPPSNSSKSRFLSCAAWVIRFANVVCTHQIIPKSPTDIESAITGNMYSFPDRRTLRVEKSVLDAARVYARENRQRNKAYIDAAIKYSIQFDKVFVIAGAAHCFKIHRDMGWPIAHTIDWEKALLSDVWLGYVYGQIFPEWLISQQ